MFFQLESLYVCVCVCRSSCLVLQGKCLWYHKKKIEEYRKKEKQKERLHINKKKMQEEIKGKRRIRKETSSVCALLWYQTKKADRKNYFLLSPLCSWPNIFFLSFHPSVILLCVYCERACHSLILGVLCLHIFWFFFLLYLCFFIKREKKYTIIFLLLSHKSDMY